ncbi:Transposase [Pirellulimonas nuda]|uniref:Transposase n=1 Tax=Pirellulimonas nuda TaxID=2528009 RepID=A0A518DBY2_9BACT|nr:ISL3 family transposase [Pirellulimonas nuda]QDU88978.1 Transposase [Pirellulimonas nuda]
MQLKTILNHVERHKSFVYQEARWADSQQAIEVPIAPRANGQAVCSGCGEKRPGYDRLPERRFAYVPLWQISVFLVYAMRRVDCPACGVKVERVPWCDGKSQLTTTYRWFLAAWAKRLSWRGTALAFDTSWQNVFRSVRHAVLWGLAHRGLEGIEAIGVDEVAWKKGHKYLTLVYQIDEGGQAASVDRSGPHRGGVRGVLRGAGKGAFRQTEVRVSAEGGWKPYLKVIAARAGQAVHVLDRFHIMQKMNGAIDEIRAGEAKQMKADGYEPVLKHSRWCLLKRKENLTEKQTVKLSELLKYNLRSVRAHLLRGDFQRFWEYVSPGWAGRFLDEWCTRTMRSQLEPMKKVARTLRSHRRLILNWFRAKGAYSSGVVEGFNNKVKLTTRKSYGFRTYEAAQIALYHNLGSLPEPEFTHRFW